MKHPSIDFAATTGFGGVADLRRQLGSSQKSFASSAIWFERWPHLLHQVQFYHQYLMVVPVMLEWGTGQAEPLYSARYFALPSSASLLGSEGSNCLGWFFLPS